MKLHRILFASLLVAFAGRDATAQTTMPWWWFDYFTCPGNAALIGQTSPGGLTWVAAGSGATQPTIQPGNLPVPGLAAPAGNHVRVVAGDGPSARLPFGVAATNGSVFFSFTMKVADLTGLGTASNSFAALTPSGATQLTNPTNDYIPLFIRPATGGYQIGVAKSSSQAGNIAWHPSVFATNETVFVAGRYEFIAGLGNDTARLWINPSPATFGASNAPPPTLSVTAGADAPQLAGFDLFQRPSPLSPAKLELDELRFADNWAAVTPPAQPVSSPSVAFHGLLHEALNGAQLNVASNLLSVTATGATGGVKVSLGDSDGFAAAFTGLSGLEAASASVQFSAYGNTAGNTNNQLLSSLRIDGHGSNATLTVDFSGMGAIEYQAFFYDGNARLLGARTVAPPPPGPAPSPFRLYSGDCPEGTIRILSIRYVNGHWVLQFECVSDVVLNPDLLENLRIVELVPVFDPNSPQALYNILRQIWIETAGLPGPIRLNDAVYKSGQLYSASGDSLLQVTDGGVTATPVGSNSTGGLVLHSGVSDLMSDVSAARFDEGVLYTARMSVSEPTASQIINSILWAGSTIQPFGTGVTYNISASLTTVSETQRNVTTDFSSLGATQVVAEVYQNSNLVGHVTLSGGNIGDVVGSNAVVEVVANPSGTAGFSFTFAGTVTFTAAGGPTYAGNEIRVLASAGALGNSASRLRLPNFEVKGRLAPIAGTGIALYERGDAPAAASMLDARHAVQSDLILGPLWDEEFLGHPTADCTGDDTRNTDDEDGFFPPTTWFDNGYAEVTIKLTGSGTSYVGIWMDYKDTYGNIAADGVFSTDEFVYSGVFTAAGEYTVPISFDSVIPESTERSVSRVVRVRVSNTRIYSNDGHSYLETGETEDHLVTIERPPAAPTTVSGLSHTALGGATLNLGTNGVEISSLGSSGQDGVNIPLPRVDAWRATLAHQLGASNRAVGSRIEWTVLGEKNGQTNQPVIAGRLERTATGLDLYMDGSLVGATNFNVEVLSNDVVIARTSATVTVNGHKYSLDEIIRLVEAEDFIKVVWQGPTGPLVDENGSYCSLFIESPSERLEIRYRPVSMTATVGKFSAVQLRGTNSGDFTLGDEAIGLLGQWHQGLGGVVLDFPDEPFPKLRVRNLGSNGDDGIETIPADGYDSWNISLPIKLAGRITQAWPDDWEMPWLTSSNSYVKWTATGRISNRVLRDLGDLTLFRGEQGTMGISARFDGIGATQAVVEVFNGPTPVGSFTTDIINSIPLQGTSQVRRVTAQVVDGSLVWSLKWDTRSAFIPPTGATLTGDRLRIAAVNPTTMVVGLRSLITRGANVESLAFRSFNTAEPQQPRLGAPRLVSGGGVTLPISTEADVSYQIEASSSLNGPWTPIGQVMGTDDSNETLFEDAVSRISNSIRLFRVRIR